MTTSVLDPFSPKTRETARISPWDQIGGSMEFNPSKLVADGGSFMKDAAEAIGGLVEIVKAQPSPESSRPQIGGQSEIRFNQSPEESQYEQALRNVKWERQVSQEQVEVRVDESKKVALATQREQVNKTIGIRNTSYENTVNEDGTLRIDVKLDYERANSQLTSEQLKANREVTVAQATNKASALQAAMEGGAGTTGPGQGNLSAQAAG